MENKLKQKIQDSFVAAMKSKDTIAKAALSGVKAKITEAEKANGNRELTEAETIKVISTAIKQRKQSYEEFYKGGREDLATREYDEMRVLEMYMPTQLSDEEITVEVDKILAGFAHETNRNKKIGQTMGAFNKQFAGSADASRVKTIIESLIH
jgi:uncharacterized protein YqeY